MPSYEDRSLSTDQEHKRVFDGDIRSSKDIWVPGSLQEVGVATELHFSSVREHTQLVRAEYATRIDERRFTVCENSRA